MNFDTIQYIDWFRENWHDVEYDLATSGLHAVTQEELGISVADLNLGKTLFFGHHRLVELISEIYGVQKDGIMITAGSTYANFLACALHLSEGDEVVVEHPVYTPLLDVVRLFGARVRFLQRKPEEGYELNLQRLNELVTKKTRMLVLTNLHNPSGAHTDGSKVRGAAEIAEDSGTHILSDEVYRDFIFDSPPPVMSSLTDLGMSTCSLSKFYGAGALRIGWLMGSPEMVNKARRVNDYMAVTASCAGENYAVKVLEKREWFAGRVKNIMSRNYPIVRAWLEGREDLDFVMPRYGLIVYPHIKNDIGTMKLAELLLEKYGTILSPGRFFGQEDHVRIGIGSEESRLRQALDNVGSALDDLG